jgi:predicted RNase H-like HicB family nuclease
MTTTHIYRDFLCTITYQPATPAFSVDFPDLPDIISSGETLTEAFAHACEALDLHVESLQKLGLPDPKAKRRLVVEII